MKAILYLCAVALFVIGLFGGLYYGFWWAFVGGFVDIINQFRAPSVSMSAVALGVGKIFFANVIGGVVFFIFIVPARSLYELAEES